MPKDVIVGTESHSAILRGVNSLADAVKVNLGPKGRNVIINKMDSSPIVTKDGVTVTREIELGDPFENMGARMVREIATKTSDIAGGGTTTATVLAQAMYREGVRTLAAGANPIAVKRGMDKAIHQIAGAIDRETGAHLSGELDRISISIPDEMVSQVGTISANNDQEIGTIIANALKKVGKDGAITVEESQSLASSLDVVAGVQFDQGYISPYFVTDPERKAATLDDPYILLVDKTLSAMKDLLPVVESVAKNGKSFLIVAEDVIGEALATLVVNKLRGTLQVAAVKAPGFGERRKATLDDLAVLTGASAIGEEHGIKLENVKLSDLGRARRAVVDQDRTIIIQGRGTDKEIGGRIDQIRRDIEKSTSDYERERLRDRLARVAGSVAVIKVGGETETDIKEKTMRVENAVKATRAAVDEGVVPGGGVALSRCSLVLDKLQVEGDERAGVNIVRFALNEPLRQIAANAGAESALVLSKVLGEKHPHFGFNAISGEIEDLVSAGVMDPTKVVRTALLNAGSMVGLMLTRDAMIGEVPELNETGLDSFEQQRERTAGEAPPPKSLIPHRGEAKPPDPPKPIGRVSPPLPPGSERPLSPRGEPQRYTDVSIYLDHLYQSDLPEATQLEDELPLVELQKYTLEVAIRSERRGIDAKKKSRRPIKNPREREEDVKVFIVARSRMACIDIAEEFDRVMWPYNTDSDSALFHLKIKDLGGKLKEQGYIEIQLYDSSLDLLDIVQARVTVVRANTKTFKGVPARHLRWPNKQKGIERIEPNTPQRALSIRVHPAEGGYRFEFLFVRQNTEILIPFFRHISQRDLDELLRRVRDFWTKLVIRNYADQLSVTQPTFAGYLNELAQLGMDAWSHLFGTRYSDMAGASEKVGELLTSLDLGPARHVQITYFGTAESDFVFPWSILYPPADDGPPVNPMQFWGARYQIEQVKEGARKDQLTSEPVEIIFALDQAFDNADAQAELLKQYETKANHKLTVTDPISTEQDLFKELIRKPSAHFAYFYCHGYASTQTSALRPDGVAQIKKEIEGLKESSPERKALETLLSLTAKMSDESWIYIGGSEIKESKLRRQGFFKVRRPIVFLNMCQSADLVPSMSTGFIRTFLDHNASAVVGTESPMTAVFANAFAKHVLDELFAGEDIGTALWKARVHFLSQVRNPLGLAYTLYGRATARIGTGMILTASESSLENKSN